MSLGQGHSGVKSAHSRAWGTREYERKWLGPWGRSFNSKQIMGEPTGLAGGWAKGVGRGHGRGRVWIKPGRKEAADWEEVQGG